MSSAEEGVQRHLAKGKARAVTPDVDESTPLLASGSGAHETIDLTPRRRRISSLLLSVFLFSLAFCVIIFILVAILAYTLGSSASGISDEDIQHALVARGPDRVDVVRVTSEGGLWVNVKGRIGMDAGAVMGFNTETGDGVFRDLWKSVGRWGVRQVDRVSVNLTTIDVTSNDIHLANITLQPLEIPLTANPPPDDTWLSPIVLPVYILPTHNVSALVAFLRESWQNGTMHVQANVREAVVHGGTLNDGSWKSWISVTRSRVHSRVQMKGAFTLSLSVTPTPHSVSVFSPSATWPAPSRSQ